ncbi:MAG: hypothetical protein ABI877_11265 [Gemmatimonadaceae bacterium]
MAKRTNGANTAIAPHERKLTSLQAARLEAPGGLKFSEIEGRTLAELCETHRFLVDAELFLRTICGRQANLDSTGLRLLVRLSATAHAPDTDRRFGRSFAQRWPWDSSSPFACRREAICGRRVDWKNDRVPNYFQTKPPVAIVN